MNWSQGIKAQNEVIKFRNLYLEFKTGKRQRGTQIDKTLPTNLRTPMASDIYKYIYKEGGKI